MYITHQWISPVYLRVFDIILFAINIRTLVEFSLYMKRITWWQGVNVYRF